MASDFYFSRNFIWLLWVVFSSQQHHRKKEQKKQEKVNGNPLFFPVRLNRLAVNAIQWRQYSFALIHAKSKTWFSSGKPRNIAWKCQHDTELLYFNYQMAEILYTWPLIPSSFPPLKQSHIHLLHDHGTVCHCMTSTLTINNWGQKYCQTLGYKPNPSIHSVI